MLSKTMVEGRPAAQARRRFMRLAVLAAAASLSASAFGSCALLSAASKAEIVFQREEDPVLAAQSLPSFIKLSEIFLETDPKSQQKLVTTASLLVTYSSAFVEGPSSLLPEEQFEERLAAARRAGSLYRRAFRHLELALERRSPGALAAADEGRSGPPLERFSKGDVPLLYWSAASILAAFALDQMDFESAKHLKAASVFLSRAEALDSGWNEGAIFELWLPYYASMPDYLGGDPAKAEEAYRRALSYSKGASPSLFVSYASSVCIPRDDYPAFKKALERALSVDPLAHPEKRLAIAIAQDRARRLLADADRYFTTGNGDKQQ